jgi:hypothetical protein
VLRTEREVLGLVRPRLLRTSLRSVRSMVGAASKLPEVQLGVVVPRTLVRRSVRSSALILPSSLMSAEKSARTLTRGLVVARVRRVVKLPLTSAVGVPGLVGWMEGWPAMARAALLTLAEKAGLEIQLVGLAGSWMSPFERSGREGTLWWTD